MDWFLDRYFLSGLTILWISFRPLLLMGHFGPFPRMGFMGLFMIYIPVGRICIIMLFVWLIFPFGYLYHFAYRMIYTPNWEICNILLVVWFIFPLGEFVSFCSLYDLYSCLENLYHFARHMIYIPTWGVWIVLLVIWFIFSLGEFVWIFSRKIPYAMLIWTFLRPFCYLH